MIFSNLNDSMKYYGMEVSSLCAIREAKWGVDWGFIETLQREESKFCDVGKERQTYRGCV